MTVYYKMRQMLLQNETTILLQNVTEVYYKMRQAFYYKMRQFHYKIRQLRQYTLFKPLSCWQLGTQNFNDVRSMTHSLISQGHCFF